MSFRSSSLLQIKPGHCYLVDMNPPRKSKPGKIRPVVVIQSADTIEAGSPGITIVPLTSQIRDENILRLKIEPSPGLKIQKVSSVLLDQVHTIDRGLFLEDLGELGAEDFEKIRDGVKFLLNF